MAIADITVLATIGISFLFGVWRGLIKEALSLVFWIGAVILASLFSTRLAVHFEGFIDNPAVQRLVAFVLIFVVTVFAGGLISNLFSKLTSAAGLRGSDRGLGGLFGIVRGLVICTLVVMLTLELEVMKPWYSESLTVPYLMGLAEYLENLFAPASPVVNLTR